LMHHHESMSGFFKYGAAVLLVILIIYGYLEKYLFKLKNKTNKETITTMSLKTINVQGMTCNHCKANVETNLRNLDFITDVKIDLPTGNIELDGNNIDLDKVKKVVNGLGYKYVD